MTDEREAVARHLDIVAERFCERAKEQSLKPSVVFEANAGRSFETRAVRAQFLAESLDGWRRAIILRCPLWIEKFASADDVAAYVLKNLVFILSDDQIPEVPYPKPETA